MFCFRTEDERIFVGRDATGRWSKFRELPAVRGLPLLSTDGRGPSLTFGVYPAARSKSRSEGRLDWLDNRASSEGRGNSSKIVRYLELERERSDFMDLGDIVADCGSTGLPRESVARELDRDGGGMRSTGAFSLSGDIGGSSGSTGCSIGDGTKVASDLTLLGLRRASDWRCVIGFGASSFVPFSSASSVISISRRRRSELEEEVIEVDAVWRRQAEDRALSVRSEALDRGSMVSLGVNLSITNWNWTLLRARTD